MKLRGIDFGDVLGASGVQGFFGEGYWFHAFWKYFGLNFSGMTFVSKTATFCPRPGNMPLENYHPRDFFPSCVYAKFWKGLVLNAVGLSNPGLSALLSAGEWQKRTKPFMISVASVAQSQKDRLEELRAMVDMLGFFKKDFKAPFGLQINLSCPNTGHALSDLIAESEMALEIASALDVPLMPKYSIASAPTDVIARLNNNPHCDAICVSNTVPFGWCWIDWEEVWGSKVSPLESLGGGGLSGKNLCPFVCKWIKDLRGKGFAKPINGGGGILSCEDVNNYYQAGASSIFLGSVATLRPWRVQKIIGHANSIWWPEHRIDNVSWLMR